MVPQPCDLSMESKLSNKSKSLQIYSVYPIFTSIRMFVSNPNSNTLDRRGQRYRPPTSRFQKTDMLTFAVTVRNKTMID